jgi:hypothetical protein
MEDAKNMSRVENMFGPRESWGQGDEMAAVRERAVRQEGGRKHRQEKGEAACGWQPPAAVTHISQLR